MTTPMLLEVPKTHLTQRQKIALFKKVNKIETRREVDGDWKAELIVDVEEPLNFTMGSGETEREALIDLQKELEKKGKPLPFPIAL